MQLEELRNWYKNDHVYEEYHEKEWFETVDPWIRPLVKYLNELPGCATICSCAGKGPRAMLVNNFGKWHKKDESGSPWLGYVWLTCKSVETLALIMSAVAHVNGHVRLVQQTNTCGPGVHIVAFYAEYKELKIFHRILKTFVNAYKTTGELKIKYGRS